MTVALSQDAKSGPQSDPLDGYSKAPTPRDLGLTVGALAAMISLAYAVLLRLRVIRRKGSLALR